MAADDQHTGCPICRSDDYIELDPEDADGLTNVKRCEECGEEWQ